jgi:hypothetical protein
LLPSTAKKTVVSKDGCSVYIEVFRRTFKDVGRLGSEETGAHEFHFRTAEGFGFKFDLQDASVDERLLRDVARTSIEKWLGHPPEMREASKVTHIMHGTWQVPEKGTGRTLLGPEQFLNCMADAIAASEIAHSDIRLVHDAEEAIRSWERLGMSSSLGMFRDLKQKSAAMKGALEQESPEPTALAASDLEECLLNTLNRLRQKSEVDALLSECGNCLRQLDLEIERALDGPAGSYGISNRYAFELDQSRSKLSELLASEDTAGLPSKISSLHHLISRIKTDSLTISQIRVREPIRIARRLARETKDDPLERMRVKSAELSSSALRAEDAVKNGVLEEAVSAREEMTHLSDSVAKELAGRRKVLEGARKGLSRAAKFLADLEKKPDIGLERSTQEGLKRAISNLERALASGDPAIITPNLAALSQDIKVIEVAEELKKKREVATKSLPEKPREAPSERPAEMSLWAAKGEQRLQGKEILPDATQKEAWTSMDDRIIQHEQPVPVPQPNPVAYAAQPTQMFSKDFLRDGLIVVREGNQKRYYDKYKGAFEWLAERGFLELVGRLSKSYRLTNKGVLAINRELAIE